MKRSKNDQIKLKMAANENPAPAPKEVWVLDNNKIGLSKGDFDLRILQIAQSFFKILLFL